jgi:hypothetical protein
VDVSECKSKSLRIWSNSSLIGVLYLMVTLTFLMTRL